MTEPSTRTDIENVKKDAERFGAANPVIGSALMKKIPDPDAEIFFSAVIYMIRLLFRKLKAEFTGLTRSLLSLIAPQDLQEIPAETILTFRVNAPQTQTVRIPKGTQTGSIPVDGERCIFTTAEDLEAHPVDLTDARHEQLPGNTGRITLTFASGIPLDDWQPETLTLFLTEDHAPACDLYLALRRATRITLTPLPGEGTAGESVELPPSCLTPCGFDEDTSLLYPGNAHPGYHLLQAYFAHANRFLMFKLTGWDRWLNRGDAKSFDMAIDIGDSPPPRVSRESFAVNAVCAINAFSHSARPIIADHRKESYLLRPEGNNPAHYSLLSVESVSGYAKQSKTSRNWRAFDQFNFTQGEPVYRATRKGANTWLELFYPAKQPLIQDEIISTDLICGNGDLPETLRAGDIRHPVSRLPEGVSFHNISGVTPRRPFPKNEEERLSAHLAMNQNSLEDQATLLALLEMYAGGQDAHLKRIAGIESVTGHSAVERVKGVNITGREIRLRVRRDHFASSGDLYLFGSVLARFLSMNCALNTFARLVIDETTRGGRFVWPGKRSTAPKLEGVHEPGETFPGQKTSGEPEPEFQAEDASAFLLSDLTRNGVFYSFVQVARLAQKLKQRISVRAELSLGFPPADIARILLQKGRLVIYAAFLRLIDCLPTHYAESLIDDIRSKDSTVCRDFFDIFQGYLYDLHTAVWRKYHLPRRMVEEENPPDRERLLCLAGFGSSAELRGMPLSVYPVPESRRKEETFPEIDKLPRYAGLFAKRQRSAAGLRALLCDYFGMSCIHIEEGLPRKAPIPREQQLRLDGTKRLGIDTVLGSYVPERQVKFIVHIGPLTKKGFDSFLPDGSNHAILSRLIALYVSDPLDYAMHLSIGRGEAKPMRLGGPDSPRLGYDSWLLSEPNKKPLVAVFYLRTYKITNRETAQPSAEPATFAGCYRGELASLQTHVDDFTACHPVMTPFMNGQTADPGAERVKQGAAFCGAQLQMKLQDDFPEIMHPVMETLMPNVLRPVPAATIIAFAPKANFTGSQIIPAGTAIDSEPVQGTPCRFTTSYPVELHPLEITDAAFVHPSGRAAMIILKLKLTASRLSSWKPQTLRFFLSGHNADALNLNLILMRYLQQIVIQSGVEGPSLTLDAEHLTPLGFAGGELLFSGASADANGGHRTFQEYFIQPDRFKLLELQGLDKWRNKGDGVDFEIRFELKSLPFRLHEITKADFTLFAAPAVNLFKHKAAPFEIREGMTDYRIEPDNNFANGYDIYAVAAVAAQIPGASRLAVPLEPRSMRQKSATPVYEIKRHHSSVTDTVETVISLEHAATKQITGLDISLVCTNGSLTEQLGLGDVCNATDNSPGFATFGNCTPVTQTAQMNMAHNTLWRLYSLDRLNLGLLDAQSLQNAITAILKTYDRPYMITTGFLSQIQGIADLDIKGIDRLIGGKMYRGWEIRIQMNPDHYASPGEQYLFGALLEHYLNSLASQLVFTRTFIEDTQGKTSYLWPERMGQRPLL